MKGRLILACSIVALVAGFVATQSAEAQWRTHYVRRDGLFHVEKYKTGNGLTPIGGAVLTTLIGATPDILNAAAGRDLDQDQSRGVDESWKASYAEQQKAANDLLERTAALVGYKPPVGSQQNIDKPPPPPPGGAGTPTTVQESGPDPWPARKD